MYGASSFAQSAYPWVVAYETSENSKTASGFEMLKQKHPNEFKNWQASQVETANFNARVYEYTGASTCPANDPRLFFTGTGYGLCERSTGGMGSCFQTVTMMPFPQDPCAN